jgi:hypothetical protein
MSDRRLAEAIVMKGCSSPETSPNNHAVTIPRHPVTNGTEDIVPLTPARDRLFADGKGKSLDVIRECVLSSACGRIRSRLRACDGLSRRLKATQCLSLFAGEEF